MKRITQIAKKNDITPELGYALFCLRGLIIYNGSTGILYSPEAVREPMMNIVKEHGTFGIPDAAELKKCIDSLEKVSSIKMDESKKFITFKYNEGRGTLKVPVVCPVNELALETTFALPWRTFDKDSATNKIPIGPNWLEVSSLVVDEGEAFWGQSLGLYGHNNRLMSFDSESFIVSKDEGYPDFFCPRALLALGTTGIQYAETEGDNFFMVGLNHQYISTKKDISPAVKEVSKLKDNFDNAVAHKISLDTSPGIWNRGKKFSPPLLPIKVSNGKITVGAGSRWEEQLGEGELPDASFLTRMSLLERWATGTIGHSIAINSDGQWFLHGESRNGFLFYARLTDVQNPTLADLAVPESASASEDDVSDDVAGRGFA